MTNSTTSRETPTVGNPTGPDRNPDIVLAAAVIAMGLFAGLSYTFTTARLSMRCNR
jgi:hypothetical protein